MKYSKLFLLAALPAVVFSCAKEIDSPQSESKTGITQITASFADAGKTVLAEDQKTVLWNPNEEINVFYNTAGAKFISMNTKPVDQTMFVSASEILFAGTEGYTKDYIYGVYPYSESNSQQGDVLCMDVPARQFAVQGSFGNGAFPSVGRSKDTSIAFYNVCGGIGFSVTQQGVYRIRIKGNNNEDLAGRVNVRFDGEGKPYVQNIEKGEKEIIIDGCDTVAQEINIFEPGKIYYCAILPQTLSNGFSVSLYSVSMEDEETKIARKTVNQSVEIQRSVLGKIQEIDKDLTYNEGIHDIAFNSHSVLLLPDETFQLSCIVTPQNADYNWIKWYSSDEAIAKVDDKGLVTAISKGSCIINCEADNAMKAYCFVMVDDQEPSITLDHTGMAFSKDASSQDLILTSNREWELVKDEQDSWVTVTPSSGYASAGSQLLSVSVDENTGASRSATLVFSTGSATATLEVLQEGSESVVYFNNFDKEPAVQTSNKWPYIYATDCWKNETGTGIANVRYITEGNKATIRNIINSTGSGVNNVFFAADSRFCVKNIKLTQGVANYTLSFYGIRSVYGTSTGEGKSIFDHSQFKLYISCTGEKWVSLDYTFEGGDPDNAWGKASVSFTVPAGTNTLCIGIPCPSEASSYRIDDLKLVETATAGTAIDFSQGIEIAEFKEVEPFDPSKVEAKTVQEFITIADKTNYYKLTGTISSFNKSYCSFDLTDATGKVYVYSVVDSCKTKYSSLLKDGDVVTLAGKYEYYAKGSKHEVVNAIILSYKTPEHKPITTDKVSEAIAAEVGDTVILNGATVVAVANTSYLVTDATKTGYVLVFQKTAGADTPVAIGDVVNVKSIRADYCSMPQLNSPATTVVSSGTKVTWPEPEDITSTFDSFTSTTVKYVSFKGQLTVNGNYYNVAVNGAQTNIGSLLPATAADKWKDLPNTTFKGYYIYTASSKYVTIIFTEAEASTDPYLVVTPKKASVAATAGSTTINVSSNVDWTARQCRFHSFSRFRQWQWYNHGELS